MDSDFNKHAMAHRQKQTNKKCYFSKSFIAFSTTLSCMLYQMVDTQTSSLRKKHLNQQLNSTIRNSNRSEDTCPKSNLTGSYVAQAGLELTCSQSSCTHLPSARTIEVSRYSSSQDTGDPINESTEITPTVLILQGLLFSFNITFPTFRMLDKCSANGTIAQS